MQQIFGLRIGKNTIPCIMKPTNRFVFYFFRTNMEDLRFESALQYWSIINEKDMNEMLNGTTLLSSNLTSFNTTSDQLLNVTASDIPTSQIPPKEWYIIVYSIFIAAAVVLTPLSRNVCYLIFMRASKSLHNKMFNNILQAPMRFFDTNPSGKQFYLF